jgi:hypothetical protein
MSQEQVSQLLQELKIGLAAFNLSLKYGVTISWKFINESQWKSLNSALLLNIRMEAIAA